LYSDPLLIFYGMKIAYCIVKKMTAFRIGFPEPATENMRFFSIRPARQNSCRKKPKVDQYILKKNIMFSEK